MEVPVDKMKEMNNFHEGEYIVYINDDIIEIGKIKKLTNDGAFVYYNTGNTASKTAYQYMHKILNEYCIKETYLGNF